MNRVGVLFRPGSPWLGGFYYLQNLLLALRALPDEERPATVAYVGAGAAVPPGELEELTRVVGFRAPHPRRTAGTRARDALRRADAARRRSPWSLAGALRAAPADVVFPHFDEGRTLPAASLPWIPDLQHLHLPEYFSPEERELRTETYRRMLERSPLVVVSSETAASELEDRFPGARSRLRVLRFTTVPRPAWTAADPRVTARRYGVARPYLMLPNQLWVHKNHLTAFEAIRLLRAEGEDVTLVCTGGAEDYRHPDHPARLAAWIEEAGLEDRIRLLGVVPREDYAALVRGSAGVVQPSRFEGWSSIVEDARALGKRLVLSDLPVHREQDPDGARYVDPDDPAGFAAAMRDLLHEEGECDEERALAAQRARVGEYARAFVALVEEAAA